MLCCLAVQAQDMNSLYIAMPDSLSPLLTKVNREDFGDFLASNMKAEVKNRFGNTAEMTRLTDDYLSVQVSESSREEMKLLPLNDSVKVICVVRTYFGPVADSKASFYDTQWHELPASRFLSLPPENRFYLPPATEHAADSLKNLRLYADMYLTELRLSDQDRTLTITYTTPDYMDEDTASQLQPYLRQVPLVFEWKEGRFVETDDTATSTPRQQP